MAFTNFTRPNLINGGAAVATTTVLMKLNRNKTVASTLGHMITFTKDVPMEIPLVMVRSCAEIGAERVDGKDAIVEEVEEKVNQPIDPGVRLDAVGVAIQAIVDRNDSQEFTAAGMPQVKVVSTEVGYRVDKTEVTAAWKARAEDD
jgi:hypothetical protein